jgi:hypothetical protein
METPTVAFIVVGKIDVDVFLVDIHSFEIDAITVLVAVTLTDIKNSGVVTELAFDSLLPNTVVVRVSFKPLVRNTTRDNPGTVDSALVDALADNTVPVPINEVCVEMIPFGVILVVVGMTIALDGDLDDDNIPVCDDLDVWVPGGIVLNDVLK